MEEKCIENPVSIKLDTGTAFVIKKIYLKAGNICKVRFKNGPDARRGLATKETNAHHCKAENNKNNK